MGGEGEKWCVVTGGRGFAARHLVEMLVRSEEWLVRIADLAQSLSLDPSEEEGDVGRALRSGRAAYVSADLRNKAQVVAAFEGAEVVFHMAAPDSSINSYQLHYSVNVQGTKNVIDACIECKVKRLIYTSSPSVVFDGVNGIYYGGEAMPYPKKFNDSYSETKAEGEKLVMNANGRCGLLTCCIRPSSIFGPGDRLLVPSLVNAARAGKSKFIIGDGDNVYDFTYVENVAYGHICAERTLAAGGVGADRAAGQAYFITNMEPIKFWEFVSLILEGLGYESVAKEDDPMCFGEEDDGSSGVRRDLNTWNRLGLAIHECLTIHEFSSCIQEVRLLNSGIFELGFSRVETLAGSGSLF